MRQSKAFEDYIFRTTIKGITRRNGRIEIERSLSDYILGQLTEHAIKYFGYSIASEARNDINQLYSRICESALSYESITNLDLRTIPSGTIVSFINEDDWELNAIISKNGSLFVIEDEEHTLESGDELRALTLILRCGNDAVFQVLRDGLRYPSEQLYFKLDTIRSINVIKNSGPDNLDNNSVPVPIVGHTRLYALNGDISGKWFNYDLLTEDPAESLFVIEFNPDGSISYSYNENNKFDFSALQGQALIDKYDGLRSSLFNMCDVAENAQNKLLTELTTSEKGILFPDQLANGTKRLKLIKKAQLT